MLNLLEKKRKITHLIKKEKREIISLIKKKRLRRAIGQKTREKIAIYYASIRIIFTFYGNKIRCIRLTKKINAKISGDKLKTI
jgi:hypothetical protein